jgi:type VI secretion system secreted protein Hcp
MGRGISSGGEASCPSISEVTITKQLDSATPKIIGDFIMGQVYEEVVVSWNLSSGAGDYLKVTMGEAQLSGYSTSSGGDRPSENLSIHFATMKGEYRTIEKDGKLSSTSIKWDLNDKTCR